MNDFNSAFYADNNLMKEGKGLWTKEELILAFNLYLKLPFGKMHSNNSNIIYLAKLIGRTSNSVAMRLSNFASIDPYHQKRGVVGLPGGRKQCQPIWDEFNENRENLIFESERILAEKENIPLEEKFNINLNDIQDLKGETKLRLVKTRVNQNVFRQIIVSSYSYKCAITGIDIPELLVASHIIPWSVNEQERLNPENGICLSNMYDKIFDKGLIGINSNFEIHLSNDLKGHINKDYFQTYFSFLEGKKINIPDKYQPRKDFLAFHYETIYRK